MSAIWEAAHDAFSRVSGIFLKDNRSRVTRAQLLRVDSKFCAVLKRHLSECGVSLTFLAEFSKAIDPSLSTAEVVRRFIIPQTLSKRGRYVDVIDQRQVGDALYFVSHAWQGNFVQMAESLLQHFNDSERSYDGGPASEVFVWIDIFAINQHIDMIHRDDFYEVAETISRSKGLILVLDERCHAMHRLWCLYELWEASSKEVSIQVLASHSDPNCIEDCLHAMDIRTAKASNEVDKTLIIESSLFTKGMQRLNKEIRKALVDGAKLAATSISPLRLQNQPRLSAKMLHSAALLLHASGRYTEAALLYPDAVELMREHLDEYGHVAAANALRDYSRLKYCFKNYHEAQVLAEEAMELLKSPDQRRTDELAEVLCTLGNVAVALYNIDTGRRYYNEALRLQISRLGVKHPSTARTVCHLGNLESKAGNTVEAFQLLRQARKVVGKRLGPRHPDVARINLLTATLFHEQGKLAQSEQLVQEALAINQESLGPAHPYTADCLSLQADVLLSRLDQRHMEMHVDSEHHVAVQKAVQLYMQAFDVYRHTKGSQHPDTILVLMKALVQLVNSSSGTARQMWRMEPVCRMAIKSSLVSSHQSMFSRISQPHSCEEELDSHRKVLTFNLIYAFNMLAQVLACMDKYTEAQAICNEAIDLAIKQLGAGHRLVAHTCNTAGLIAQGMGDEDLADAMYDQALIVASDLVNLFTAPPSTSEKNTLARMSLSTVTGHLNLMHIASMHHLALHASMTAGSLAGTGGGTAPGTTTIGQDTSEHHGARSVRGGAAYAKQSSIAGSVAGDVEMGLYGGAGGSNGLHHHDPNPERTLVLRMEMLMEDLAMADMEFMRLGNYRRGLPLHGGSIPQVLQLEQAAIQNNMAVVQWSFGNTTSAEELLRLALEASSMADHVTIEASTTVALMQVNYATVLVELGELADAHKLFSTACSFLVEQQPLDAMVAALMHVNLLHTLGNHLDALQVCKDYISPVLRVALSSVEDASVDTLVHALALHQDADDGVKPLSMWAAGLTESVKALPSVAFVLKVPGIHMRSIAMMRNLCVLEDMTKRKAKRKAIIARQSANTRAAAAAAAAAVAAVANATPFADVAGMAPPHSPRAPGLDPGVLRSAATHPVEMLGMMGPSSPPNGPPLQSSATDPTCASSSGPLFPLPAMPLMAPMQVGGAGGDAGSTPRMHRLAQASRPEAAGSSGLASAAAGAAANHSGSYNNIDGLLLQGHSGAEDAAVGRTSSSMLGGSRAYSTLMARSAGLPPHAGSNAEDDLSSNSVPLPHVTEIVTGPLPALQVPDQGGQSGGGAPPPASVAGRRRAALGSGTGPHVGFADMPPALSIPASGSGLTGPLHALQQLAGVEGSDPRPLSMTGRPSGPEGLAGATSGGLRRNTSVASNLGGKTQKPMGVHRQRPITYISNLYMDPESASKVVPKLFASGAEHYQQLQHVLEQARRKAARRNAGLRGLLPLGNKLAQPPHAPAP